jgi:C1A family cysteine protease
MGGPVVAQSRFWESGARRTRKGKRGTQRRRANADAGSTAGGRLVAIRSPASAASRRRSIDVGPTCDYTEVSTVSLTPRKIKRYGWIPDHPDPRDRIYNLEAVIKEPEDLPPSIDLTNEMPPIWDQGELGSCTANGNAAVFEHAETHEGEGAVTPSRLFLYYAERELEGTVNEDSGAQVRTGIKVLANDGVPPENEWPYDIAEFAKKPPQQVYADARKHEAITYQRILAGGPGAPLRTALAEHKPIVFGFSVPERFESPSWNPATQPLPLPSKGEKFIGGHCTVVTGYDFTRQNHPFDIFKIRNSWGSEWGDNGSFYMQGAWLNQTRLGLSSDFWVITRTT